MTFVIKGRSIPSPSNISINVGITNVIIKTTATTATILKILGYVMADLTLLLILFSFSKWTDILSIISSIFPLTSPDSTILIKSCGKYFLCFAIDSDKSSPFLTSSSIIDRSSLNFLLGISLDKIFKQVVIVTPASSIV